ncbi:lysoplasmalogenase TMEM86B-like [Clavelina lepadiformis]|uniref:lysoplasmalogenase TMEM86B-like n=1 Tax=Clavelina lepadiformis TaxID=159417 RepID=UPI004041BD78
MDSLRPFLFFSCIFFLNKFAISLNYLQFYSPTFLILKCVPILSLAAFVRGKFDSFARIRQDRHGYRIFIGLCLSMFADAALVYQDNLPIFLIGIGLFFTAHMAYVFAFGWKDFKLKLMILCAVAAVVTHQSVAHNMKNDLPEVLKTSGIFYTLAIFSMIWRALARLDFGQMERNNWRDVSAGIGAILFVISDIILCVNKFVTSIHAAGYIVMTTYYAAQLGIALSVPEQPVKLKP